MNQQFLEKGFREDNQCTIRVICCLALFSALLLVGNVLLIVAAVIFKRTNFTFTMYRLEHFVEVMIKLFLLIITSVSYVVVIGLPNNNLYGLFSVVA